VQIGLVEAKRKDNSAVKRWRQEASDANDALALFLAETEIADEPAVIVKALETALEALGLKKYLYLYASIPFTHDDPPLYFSNLEQAWIDRYIAEGLYLHDPALQIALRDVIPFDWSDLRLQHNLSTTELKFLEESDRHGYGGGVVFPIMGPGPARGALSIPQKNGERPLCGGPQLHMCHLLALHFHSRLRPFLRRSDDEHEEVKITRRELECVLWAARGKTSWETAVILNISEATVNFHLTNAMKKLRVFSRAHAIAKAVGLGLIYL